MNKVVFITGGSRGIGKETVKIFAKNGYSVFFTYLNSEKEAKILADETSSVCTKMDVSDSASVNLAIDMAIKTYGKIDVLINNAAISNFSLITDIDDENWNKMISTNLSGTFYTCRGVLKHMIKRKSGVIINISSMWGQTGASCEAHYSASKAGVIGLTKAIAKEVGPSGIRVNCVCPGTIDTDMNSALSKEDINQIKEDTPLNSIGSASDVSKLLLFLASDDSGYITGQIIGINGGYVI